MGGYYNGSSGNTVEAVDWIHLAQDRDQWRALLNMVMYLLHVP
jgi:hypothetical protein